MKSHLSEIVTDTVKIFDGLEQNMFNQVFKFEVTGYGQVELDPSLIDKNKFDNLSKLIGEAAVTEIAEKKHFKFEEATVPGYVGTKELDLRYLLMGDTLLIFSLGEYQPARFIFYFEGAWKVSSVS